MSCLSSGLICISPFWFLFTILLWSTDSYRTIPDCVPKPTATWYQWTPLAKVCWRSSTQVTYRATVVGANCSRSFPGLVNSWVLSALPEGPKKRLKDSLSKGTTSFSVTVWGCKLRWGKQYIYGMCYLYLYWWYGKSVVSSCGASVSLSYAVQVNGFG